MRQELRRRKYCRIFYQFPNDGDLSRDKYSQHISFLKSTAHFRECAFQAANRVGKTETGAYAVAVWLTGEYPEWWDGKRFNGPVNILVCGETGKLVRDSVQKKLLGSCGAIGTGSIPKDSIIETRPKAGIPDAFDTVRVRHKNGSESILQFQSYDQGREAFQATERHVIWEDEEPPINIHNENLIRTMTTNGVVLLTFTPLKGLSTTVLQLQEKASNGLACITTATWDDAPHLDEKTKTELLASLPPYQRDARSKGIPQLGSGAVYPIQESEFIVKPFQIPKHFRCGYGLDVGWNNTAAVWFAHDADKDIVYITHDYKRGHAEPSVHAAAIRARGDYVGVIDPASRGRSQKDGESLIHLYGQQGLDLRIADNTVEAGIFDVYERFTTGRLKVFETCQNLISELRIYRRDEKGRIVKENDHNCDALRYAIRSGLLFGKTEKKNDPVPMMIDFSGGSFMGV